MEVFKKFSKSFMVQVNIIIMKFIKKFKFLIEGENYLKLAIIIFVKLHMILIILLFDCIHNFEIIDQVM